MKITACSWARLRIIDPVSGSKQLDEIGKVNLASECYVVKNGQVLLFKRSENAKKFPGFWIGPGGHIDEHEDALTAAIREVVEETGIAVDEKDVKLKAVAFHYHEDLNEVWISNIYLATIPQTADAHSGQEGEGKGGWVSISQVLTMNNVFPPAKFYFDHVLGDKPGIMYANIRWNHAQLVKINSQRVDTNY